MVGLLPLPGSAGQTLGSTAVWAGLVAQLRPGEASHRVPSAGSGFEFTARKYSLQT